MTDDTHVWDFCATELAAGGTTVKECPDKDRVMRAPPGGVSDWIEVGSAIDNLNSCEGPIVAATNKAAASQLSYVLEVGLLVPPANASASPPDGSGNTDDSHIEPIATFTVQGCTQDAGSLSPFGASHGVGSLSWPSTGPWVLPPSSTLCGGLELTYDASTRGSRRVRRVEDQFYSVFEKVKVHNASLPGHLRPPREAIVVTAPSFTTAAASAVPDPNYNSSVKLWGEMYHSLGFTDGFADEPANNYGIPRNKSVNCARRAMYTSFSPVGLAGHGTQGFASNYTMLSEAITEAYYTTENYAHCIGRR
jgi:hypothetical protein